MRCPTGSSTASSRSARVRVHGVMRRANPAAVIPRSPYCHMWPTPAFLLEASTYNARPGLRSILRCGSITLGEECHGAKIGAPFNEFIKGTTIGHVPALQEQESITVADSAQAVRNHDEGLGAVQGLDSPHDFTLC